MVENIIYKSLVTLDDFKNAIIAANNMVWNDTPSGLPTDQCSYDSTNGYAIINSSNAKKGCFSTFFTDLSYGDVIEVEAEIKKVSGASSPLIGIYESNYLGVDVSCTAVQTTSTNEWEKIRLKYFFTKVASSLRCDVGYYTADVGMCYIRNFKASVNYAKQKGLADVKKFAIQKNSSGTWELVSTRANDLGSVAVNDTYTLRVNFTIPFFNRGDIVPICLVTMDSSSPTKTYIILVGDANKNFVQIKFYNTSGVLQDLSTIPNSTMFNLAVFGNI